MRFELKNIKIYKTGVKDEKKIEVKKHSFSLEERQLEHYNLENDYIEHLNNKKSEDLCIPKAKNVEAQEEKKKKKKKKKKTPKNPEETNILKKPSNIKENECPLLQNGNWTGKERTNVKNNNNANNSNNPVIKEPKSIKSPPSKLF